MKKLFLLLMTSALGLTITGCNNKKDTVNVDFKVGDISNVVKVDKGTVLTKDSVPFSNSVAIDGLYYNSDVTELYDQKPINGDITMYVKLANEEELYKDLNESQILEIIRNDYLNQIDTNVYGEDLTLEDVKISKYYGNYNDSYVVQFAITGEGAGWFLMTEYNIDGVSLVFPTATKTPYVWHKGYFYTLENAYKNGNLNKSNLESIASILESNNN